MTTAPDNQHGGLPMLQPAAVPSTVSSAVPSSASPSALFTCPKTPGHLKLSPEACAARWRCARREKADVGHPLRFCRSCAIGVRHAGVVMMPQTPGAHELRRLVERCCSRCGRQARRLISGRLCPSCYNRHAEVLRARNARGKLPRKLRLVTFIISIFDADDMLERRWSAPRQCLRPRSPLPPPCGTANGTGYRYAAASSAAHHDQRACRINPGRFGASPS